MTVTKKMENREERVEISEAIGLAEAAGFNRTEQYRIGTAVSELARNIFTYANRGEVTIRTLKRGTKNGIEIVAEDNSPGIADIGSAMEDHFSTSDSLGLGLSGAKRLMREFHIDSELGVGTKITMRKWI